MSLSSPAAKATLKVQEKLANDLRDTFMNSSQSCDVENDTTVYDFGELEDKECKDENNLSRNSFFDDSVKDENEWHNSSMIIDKSSNLSTSTSVSEEIEKNTSTKVENHHFHDFHGWWVSGSGGAPQKLGPPRCRPSRCSVVRPSSLSSPSSCSS